MKNYRIREGSIAWYAKKYGRLIITLSLIVVVMAVSICTNYASSRLEGEEKVKVEEVITEEEKMLVKELTGFAPLDVPLQPALQEFIFAVAEDYGLTGELVLAVIGQESNYKADSIGDEGNAYGLMQVHPSQHEARMERLKVENLLDPYENVVVGIDYLAECIAEGGLEWGLMAYNGGPSYANEMTKQGVLTEYAESVIYLSEDL